MSTTFLITALVIVLIPGSGVIYTLSTGLAHGTRASVIAAVGCTLGIVPPMLAAIAGLAAILHRSALAFQTMKYLGVAYLLFIAWQTLRDRDALVVDESRARPTAVQTIRSGILVNVLNPKLTIFFVAFLPQFVRDDDPHATLLMLELSAVFMLLTFVIFVGYGALAASIRQQIITRPRVTVWVRRCFAATFVALGAKLAVSSK